MLSPEDVVYWFFRLNGCLTIRNFLVHPDLSGGQRTDADLIAARFPFREELDMSDHPYFLSLRNTTLLFVEIKSAGYCRLNGPWTEPGRANLQRVLRAVGPFPARAVDQVAAELYSSGAAPAREIDVAMVAVAQRLNPQLTETHPRAVQLTWSELLAFLYNRLDTYRAQKSDHQQWETSGRRLYDLATAPGGLPSFRDRVISEAGLRAEPLQ